MTPAARLIPSTMEVVDRMYEKKPFVLESRKYGIIGNAYTARTDFYEWFFQWYLMNSDSGEYMKAWRCWETEPTDAERRAATWA